MLNTNELIWIKTAFENNCGKNRNPTKFELWIAFHFAPLLVIWSPWVNGFTLFRFFPCVLAPPFICFPSEHVNFYFIFFHILQQDNAWDYDPAAQVWWCRDSGGCSYYCHWGGSGKSPHFSGNASSDSTNPLPTALVFSDGQMKFREPLSLFKTFDHHYFSLASPHNNSRGGMSNRGLKLRCTHLYFWLGHIKATSTRLRFHFKPVF